MPFISQLRKKAILDQFGDFDPEQLPLETNPPNPDPRGMDLDLSAPDIRSSYPSGRLQSIADQSDDGGFDLRDLYHEDTDATKRFEDLLSQYPQDKGPTWGRALTSIGLGMGKSGSYKNQQDFLHAPHDRDVEDWKNKTQPYYEAANLERQGNINNRTLAYNAAQARNAEEKNRIQEQRYDDQAESARMRNMINEAKSKQFKIVTMGTRVKAVDPNNPNNVIDIGDSGKMDQRELEILKGGYQVKAAEARGASSYANTVVRESETYQDSAGNRYSYDPSNPTQLTPMEDAPEKPIGPIYKIANPAKPSTSKSGSSDYMKERSAFLQQMYDDPKYRPYIERPATANGSWQLKAPKSHFIGGVDSAEQAIYDELRGKIPGTPSSTQTNKTPPPPTDTDQGGVRIEHSKSTGKYRKSVDGGKTWKIYDSYPQ